MRLLFILLIIPFVGMSQSEIDALSKQYRKYRRSNADSAYYYLNKIKTLAKKEQDWDTHTTATLYECRVAGYFFDLPHYKKGLAELKEIKQQPYYKNLEGKDKFDVKIRSSQAIYYYSIDDFTSSNELFLEQIEQFPESLKSDKSSFTTLLSAHSYLGNNYLKEGNLEQARLYFTRYGSLVDQHKEEFNLESKQHYFFNYLGALEQEEKNYEKANGYYQQALTYFLEAENTNMSINLTRKMFDNSYRIGDPKAMNASIDLLDELTANGHNMRFAYFESKAKAEAKKGNTQRAITLMTEAQNLLAQDAEQIDIALLDLEKANFLIEEQSYASAVEHLQNGLVILEDNQFSSGKKKKVKLQLQERLAFCYQKMKDWPNALGTVQQGVVTLDELKPEIKNYADKQLLIETAFPLFETGLSSIYRLYETGQEESYVEDAFYLLEKSKSVVLLENLLSSKAEEFADIPEEVRGRLKILEAQIANQKQEIEDGGTKNENLQQAYFKINQQKSRLLDSIEQNYLSYYQMKYKTDIATQTEGQEMLEPKELLLSYFFGEHELFYLSADKEKATFHKVKRTDALSQQLINYRKLLADPKSSIDELCNISNSLFSKVVAPALDQFQEVNQLLLFTDGQLNPIPFGSLCQNQERRYLFEDYIIRYAYSATFLQELNESSGLKSMLAFAPSFRGAEGESRAALSPLVFNVGEVEAVAKHFRAKTFVNEQASRTNFVENMGNFDVLHLATHAVVNDINPNQSYLAFTQTDGEEQLLHVQEIYNLPIYADMITLSACETGIGKLSKGEGAMSLARSFFYSGTPTVVSTLWKINDASSSKIMKTFYEKLSKKQPADQALQQAQLQFLQENKDNALAHPYYWAGFTVNGKADISRSKNWLVYVLGLASVLVILTFLFYRRKSI